MRDAYGREEEKSKSAYIYVLQKYEGSALAETNSGGYQEYFFPACTYSTLEEAVKTSKSINKQDTVGEPLFYQVNAEAYMRWYEEENFSELNNVVSEYDFLSLVEDDFYKIGLKSVSYKPPIKPSNDSPKNRVPREPENGRCLVM